MLVRSITVGFAALVLGATAFADSKYKVDPVHSSVAFSIKHLDTTNFYGRFNTVSGGVTLADNGDVAGLDAAVPVESVDTHNKKRDEHILGPDYFDAKQFPTITFKSTKVEKDGDAYKVTGDLTLHGETKSVTLDLKKTGSGKGMNGQNIVGIEATVAIKRTDFGMTLGKGLSDEVILMVSFEAGAE